MTGELIQYSKFKISKNQPASPRLRRAMEVRCLRPEVRGIFISCYCFSCLKSRVFKLLCMNRFVLFPFWDCAEKLSMSNNMV